MTSVHNGERFRVKLAAGTLSLGMVITLRDPAVSELAAEAGYDFTWIDMEHAPLGIETALDHVMAVRGTPTAPLVRVPWNDPVVLKPVLDLAPAGVIIPMVNSADEAKRAVAACTYPPAGIRGMGVRRGARYGAVSLDAYLKTADDDLLVMIQIEHEKALAHLDEILAVTGINGVCIGPSDLSASMGRPGHPDAPEVVEAIAWIAKAVCARGIPLGTAIGYTPGVIAHWRAWGAAWIAVASDCGSLFTAAQSIRQRAGNECCGCGEE